MAFAIVSSQDGRVIPFEYYPAATGTYHIGDALNISTGKLAKVSSALTTTPPYICNEEAVISTAGDPLCVIRTSPDVIFETTLSAETASAAFGAKLQVAADGVQVNGSATGTFVLTEVGGTAQGSVVRGRFE